MFASTAITIKHCGKKSGRNIFPALSVRNYQRYTRFGHFHAQRSSERAFVGQQIDDPLRLICRSALLGLPSSLKFSPIDTAYLCFGVRSVSTGGPDNNETADAGKVGALKNGPSSSKDAKAASSSYSSESEKSSSASHVSRTLSEKKEASGVKKATDTVQWALKSIFSLLAKSPGVMWFYITHPKDFRKKLAELKEAAVKEAHHYWMGSKLLAADVRTARHLMGRTLRGSTLSRRERKQLLRTTTDLFRLVPMSVFVLVPFMEFALPFALKIFPNMLPSTFQDSLKEEEKMKGELQMRISMAGFFQE
jgi:LETM1 and EF-hand domain-containing protein 1